MTFCCILFHPFHKLESMKALTPHCCSQEAFRICREVGSVFVCDCFVTVRPSVHLLKTLFLCLCFYWDLCLCNLCGLQSTFTVIYYYYCLLYFVIYMSFIDNLAYIVCNFIFHFPIGLCIC